MRTRVAEDINLDRNDIRGNLQNGRMIHDSLGERARSGLALMRNGFAKSSVGASALVREGGVGGVSTPLYDNFVGYLAPRVRPQMTGQQVSNAILALVISLLVPLILGAIQVVMVMIVFVFSFTFLMTYFVKNEGAD